MIKKIVISSIFAIIILSFIPVCAANIKTDLPVHVEGIDERNLKAVAITDSYNVDILTKASHEKIEKENILQAQEQEQFCSKLSLGSDNNNIEKTADVLKDQNLKLFSKPCSYENTKNLNEINNINIFMYILIFVSLGVISSLGALALKQSKRRNSNVHNSHNENGR